MPGEHGEKRTPAQLVEALRKREGSHDKLAARLGTSRQRIIQWEQGTIPKPNYAKALADLDGVNPPEAFRPPQTRAERAAELREVVERLEALEAGAAETRQRLDDQVSKTQKLNERLLGLEARVSAAGLLRDEGDAP